MQVSNKAMQELTEDAIRAQTGRGWEEWFAALDRFGAPAKGRRAAHDFLISESLTDPWWATTLVVEHERARGAVMKDGRPQGYSICVTKSIAAPVSRVFAAFADPEQMSRWFGGGTRHDFQVGGAFSNDDGNSGEFKKIREDKDLRFTWRSAPGEPESAVEVLFQAKGEAKCGIVVNHERIASRGEADGLREAWGSALQAMKAQLENGSGS